MWPVPKLLRIQRSLARCQLHRVMATSDCQARVSWARRRLRVWKQPMFSILRQLLVLASAMLIKFSKMTFWVHLPSTLEEGTCQWETMVGDAFCLKENLKTEKLAMNISWSSKRLTNSSTHCQVKKFKIRSLKFYGLMSQLRILYLLQMPAEWNFGRFSRKVKRISSPPKGTLSVVSA